MPLDSILCRQAQPVAATTGRATDLQRGVATGAAVLVCGGAAVAICVVVDAAGVVCVSSGTAGRGRRLAPQ